MGMYTGLYFKALIKEEYREMVDSAISDHDWAAIGEKFPIAKEWAKVGRCKFIPWGALCYMPDDFPDPCRDMTNGVWEVSCSLKNYEGEIQKFVEEVLKPISQEIYECFSLYEEYGEAGEYGESNWRKYVRTY